jgi:hypothetical protein
MVAGDKVTSRARGEAEERDYSVKLFSDGASHPKSRARGDAECARWGSEPSGRVRRRLLGGTDMKKIAYVLAILAAASTAAVAKDLKQEKKATAPTVAATQMTDAEMDKVTAGVIYIYTPLPVQGEYLGNGRVCMNCFF